VRKRSQKLFNKNLMIIEGGMWILQRVVTMKGRGFRRIILITLQNPYSSFILSPMAIEARKKEGESGQSLLYNLTRKVKRSGIVKEVRHRKFHTRVISRIKRRSSAIHREEKKADVERQKKLGLI
jgi:ribosomal protein S21